MFDGEWYAESVVDDHYHYRLLEEEDEVDAGLDFEDVSDLTTAEVLKTTFKLYGSIFAALFGTFLIFRNCYPKAYNVNETVEDFRTPLSANFFGRLSWMWKVFQVDDEQVFEHCGMDAIVFIRTLRYGIKVAMVGMFNSIYLIPVYVTSCDLDQMYLDSCETEATNGTNATTNATGGDNNNGTNSTNTTTCGVVDKFECGTLGAVPAGDARLIAATIASYVLFGYALYALLKEFEWYTEHRHRFLARATPDNYTVYVKHIPAHLRTDGALLDYFRHVFSHDAVLDAEVAVDLPKLAKALKEREALVAKLEHAINIWQVKGRRPRHRKTNFCCLGGESVDSIEAYCDELSSMNEKVSDMIESYEEKKAPGEDQEFREDLEAALSKSDLYQSAQKIKQQLASSSTMDMTKEMSLAEASGDTVSKTSTTVGMGTNDGIERAPPQAARRVSISDSVQDDEIAPYNEDTPAKQKKSKSPFALVKNAAERAKDSAHDASSFALTNVSAAAALVLGDDGTPRDAGFVSFRTLVAKNSAVQMIHHATPFTMGVEAAPLPKDVYWGNVGLPHKAQQMGAVLANALTAALCVFWTVPVTFVAAFGSIGQLTEFFPFLEDWIEKAPWLEMLLAQIKPFLIVILVNLLPPILTFFAKREGLVAESALQASLFFKLSVFLLIQIFFVQMISGTILSEVEAIIKDPTSIITLLAESLPEQGKSFMQYVLVQTFLNCGLEISRIQPIVMAWLRSKMGPNLTEKERESSWLFFSPLNEVDDVAFAETQAELILYYMILMVYSVLSPMMAWLMGFLFLLISMVYRNQIFFVYNAPEEDTGGILFPRFARLVISCIFIAQLTLFGALGLKQSPIAAPLLIPLMIGTVFFSMYIKQQHYLVAECLPSVMCVEEDVKNLGKIDFDELVVDKYKQPELASETMVLEPDNMPKEYAQMQQTDESQVFLTPDHSEVEVVNENGK